MVSRMIDSNSFVNSDDVHLPAMDQASLDRLRRFGGGKLLREMVSIFLETTPQRLDAARAGIGAGDAKSVEMALHSLKSSSGQLGALRMQRLCSAGEGRARQGSAEGAPEIMRALDDEYSRVRRWLEDAQNAEA